MKFGSALFCLVALLSACAPGTPDQLRHEATLKTSIIIKQDIRSVYKNLRAGLDNCAGRTSADLFESEGTGWIKISMPGIVRGEGILLYYTLASQGQNATRVEGFAANNTGSWRETIDWTSRWANGESSCP